MAYIPNTDADRARMLGAIGVESIDDLFSSLPDNIRLQAPLNIPARMDQITLTKHLRDLARKNTNADESVCFLGAGLYDHYIPPTVRAVTGRSEFFTAYTPYQPEVSQGTLQSIYEFQTLLCQLFAMEVANASMYDGATALAEAAIMAAEVTGRKQIFVSTAINPRHRLVLDTYVRRMNIELVDAGGSDGTTDGPGLNRLLSDSTAAVIVQQPNFFGCIEDMTKLSAATHRAGALLIASVDPISLGLIEPPGAYGADIAVGEGQSLGCPLGSGGPLLGLFACKEQFMRRLPGRVVGETRDADGKRAFVMTLRTREQDIRRERATSNICTNEALYALAASVYLATMGRHGLRRVAELCAQKSHYAAERIASVPGFRLAYPTTPYFKEFVTRTTQDPEDVNRRLRNHGIIGGLPLGRHFPDKKAHMLWCVTEQRTRAEIDNLVAVLGGPKP